MKNVLRKTTSIFLVTVFLTGQISASFASDHLAASLVSDSDLAPGRSARIKNDMAREAEPEAIGNGAPLLNLIKHGLPEQVPFSDKPSIVLATHKIREAVDIALKLHIRNRGNIPSQHRSRAEGALANLISLQDYLSQKLHFFNALAEGPEDYLLGFNFQGKIGLSPELVDELYAISPDRLAQYIYHECVPEETIVKADSKIDRGNHRAIHIRRSRPPYSGRMKFLH